jgi:hypothetical protein
VQIVADPVVELVVRIALTLLLATSARHKLGDFARFRAAVGNYRILPARLVGTFAAVVMASELVLATLLASGTLVETSAIATATLLLVYASAIAVNVRRGRTDLDCGCMGPASAVPVSSALVVRNLLVALASIVLVLPVSPRGLGGLGALDIVVVSAATASLVACWAASERMLALAPQVARARRRKS